ncbi:60S ribosomal protein L39-like [Marmota marmota marmota]|uniref:60S ribosomal protein L39-like n=1 Tax=Marmota marmota marmota TaxID=9994 RepID=UPI002093270A|nr:60S ribosomal protein L39-like [Marmota marmota marmota]
MVIAVSSVIFICQRRRYKNSKIKRANACSVSMFRHSHWGACTWFSSSHSHKTFRIKAFLAKKQKQNCPITQLTHMNSGNKIRYNFKRRHYRRIKLSL